MDRPGVLDRYDALVKEGAFAADAAQEAVAIALDDILEDLEAVHPPRQGVLHRLGLRRRRRAERPGGLYIWGEVGRGKTMLMDLFFEAAPVERKRRAHFNDFMQDVHARVRRAREAIAAGRLKGEDPIAPVAAELSAEAELLCFDEFAVNDVADAMILARLFGAMFENGLTLVATSNVEPWKLYPEGLNRNHFLKFVDLLVSRVRVMKLEAAGDYRLDRLTSATVYFPDDHEGRAAFDRLWRQMLGAGTAAPATLEVAGRTVTVPQALGGLALARFSDLCERPLGAGDYLALAARHHTLFLEGVPAMDGAMRNEAKRFITLIDVLYDNRVRLVVTAAAEPEALYRGEVGAEAFEFARTASRLHEMRSEGWIRATEEPPLT